MEYCSEWWHDGGPKSHTREDVWETKTLDIWPQPPQYFFVETLAFYLIENRQILTR